MGLKTLFLFGQFWHPKMLKLSKSQIDFRSFLKTGNLSLELPGMVPVVRIEKYYEFTMCLAEA